MHLPEISVLKSPPFGALDWWALLPADFERLSTTLIRPLPGGWVRCGDNFIRVANVKYGADARKLDAELAALSAAAKKILATGGADAALRAAAFYHLRFANIHPLVEANGRIGRVVLAMQLQQALSIPSAETLAALHDAQADYRGLFATNQGPLMFELLLELLCRITGHVAAPEASQLPASVEPLHPEKNVPKNASRLHPEAYLKNPALLPKPKPAQRGQPFFRKFESGKDVRS